MAKASTKTKVTRKKTAKKVTKKKTRAVAAKATDAAVEQIEDAESQSETKSEETNTMTETAEISKPISKQQAKDDAGKEKRTIDEETHAKYEEIKKGNLHITDLQKMSVEDLHNLAKKEGLTEYTGLKKQELTFMIVKERIRQNGLMYGEGVLELLPDGFGFLRTPDYNYMPCHYIAVA